MLLIGAFGATMVQQLFTGERRVLFGESLPLQNAVITVLSQTKTMLIMETWRNQMKMIPMISMMKVRPELDGMVGGT